MKSQITTQIHRHDTCSGTYTWQVQRLDYRRHYPASIDFFFRSCSYEMPATASTKPAILGSFAIKAFDPNATTWKRWLQRLQGSFLVFGIEAEARVPYLLHYVGPAAFDILCDRLDQADPFATLRCNSAKIGGILRFSTVRDC